MATLRVLLVHNDQAESERIAERLEQASHAVLPTGTFNEATRALDLQKFDVVVVAAQVLSEELLSFREALEKVEEGGKPAARIPVVCYRPDPAQSPSATELDRYRMDGCLDANFEAIAFTSLVGRLAEKLTNDRGKKGGQGLAVFQAAEFEEQLGFDPELVVEIIDLFLSDCDQQVAKMSACLESGDLLTLSRVAHSLKGSLGSLYATQAATRAQQLETAGKAGIRDSAAAALRELEQDFAALKPELLALRNQRAGS